MELPSDDEGLDLGDAPLLPDEAGLPDDDMFNDHLADADWLESSLANMVVEDSNYCDSIPMLPADDVAGMDIYEVVDEVPLPDSLARTTCHCQQKCVEHVMAVAELTVRHLRNEVRDKSFLLELVKHAHSRRVSTPRASASPHSRARASPRPWGATRCGRLQDTLSAGMRSRCS